MIDDRIVIVGGPSRGKSTLAHEFHEHGWPVFCGDPASTVRYQKPYTTYLPEGLEFAGDGGAADWVARNWFTMPGPWVCEGHVMARALGRWLRLYDLSRGDQRTDPERAPCESIIVLDRPAHRPCTPRQDGMHDGVMTQWRKIAHHFTEITEVRT